MIASCYYNLLNRDANNYSNRHSAYMINFVQRLSVNMLIMSSAMGIFILSLDRSVERSIAADLPDLADLNSQIQSVQRQPSSMQRIRRRGKLIVGVKDNLPPLGFRDLVGDQFRDRQQNMPSELTGELRGLEIDIARELAKELNLELELVPVTNRDRLSALQINQIDLAIAQITVTTNRSRLVDFSLPYYTDSTVLIAPRHISTNELQKANIAVLKNSSAIAALQWKLPQAIVIGADSYQAGLIALKARTVAAFAGDRSILTQWLIENPDYQITGQPLAVHSLAIALPRGLQHLELREAVFPIVEKWRKNGWLQDRIK
jgi:polar amino acid transport system substrate-binding protein